MKLPELSESASPEFTDAATCKAWLEHVQEMAADPTLALAYLRAAAMLDMTPVPAVARE